MRNGVTLLVLCTLLAACGGGSSGGNTPTTPPPNQAPVLSASNQTVVEGQSVTVAVSASDPDGSVTAYAWSQVSGPDIQVDFPSAAQLTFTAPAVLKTETLVLELMATDNDGARSTVRVSLTVNVNTPPSLTVMDQSVGEQSTHTMMAEAQDSDGGIASYVWEQVSGPTLLDLETNEASLTFTTPEVAETQIATVRVTVTDGYGKSTEQVFNVEVTPFAYNFTLQGRVFGSAMSEAIVTVEVGESQFQTSLNEDGTYQLDLSVHELQANQMVIASAQSTDEKVVLQSILGSVQTLAQVAGEDQVVTPHDEYAVNISHLSTAFATLLREVMDPTGFDSQQALDAAYSDLNASKFEELATVAKMFADQQASPEMLEQLTGYVDLLALLQDSANVYGMLEVLESGDTGAYLQTLSQVTDELDLFLPFDTDSVPDRMYLVDIEKTSNLGSSSSDVGRFLFARDGNGELTTATEDLDIAWSVSQGQVQLSLPTRMTLQERHDLQLDIDYKSICTEGSIVGSFITCEKQLVDIGLHVLARASGEPLVLISRTQDELMVWGDFRNTTLRKRTITPSLMYDSSTIVSAEQMLEFGKEYAFPVAQIERNDPFASVPVNGYSEAIYVTFEQGDGNSGDAQVVIPGQGYMGEDLDINLTAGWSIQDDGSLNMIVPFGFNLMVLNTVFADAHPLHPKLQVRMSFDGQANLISRRAMVRDPETANPDENSLPGIYRWVGQFLPANTVFWFELNDDGTALTVSGTDDNDDGMLDTEEVTLMPGWWQINPAGNLVVRRYRLLDQQNSDFSEYCQAAQFATGTGDSCILYHERELDVLSQSEQGSVLNIFQQNKFYNRDYRRNGQPYEGQDLLGSMYTGNIRLEKLAQRPYSLPSTQ